MIGLDNLFGSKHQISHDAVMRMLVNDLQCSYLMILGRQGDSSLLLARLPLAELTYESFDKRIDLVYEGSIDEESTPLTYDLKGTKVSISGRCSMIKCVCGVDLYLSSSYTTKKSDRVRQKISIQSRDVLKVLKSLNL